LFRSITFQPQKKFQTFLLNLYPRHHLNISDRSWVLSHLTCKRVHPVRGSLVLVAYLVPPKINATAYGEHVFFEIDVKGGEEELSGSDATVGGPNILAQSFKVAINAKGGDCWKVYSWE
jgi:hypothetical protein